MNRVGDGGRHQQRVTHGGLLGLPTLNGVGIRLCVGRGSKGRDHTNTVKS